MRRERAKKGQLIKSQNPQSPRGRLPKGGEGKENQRPIFSRRVIKKTKTRKGKKQGGPKKSQGGKVKKEKKTKNRPREKKKKKRIYQGGTVEGDANTGRTKRDWVRET